VGHVDYCYEAGISSMHASKVDIDIVVCMYACMHCASYQASKMDIHGKQACSCTTPCTTAIAYASACLHVCLLYMHDIASAANCASNCPAIHMNL